MSSKFREHTRGKIIHVFVMNKRKLADEGLLKEQCKKISTSPMIKTYSKKSFVICGNNLSRPNQVVGSEWN